MNPLVATADDEPDGADAAWAAALREYYRVRLERFYQEAAPSKLEQPGFVDALLQKHKYPEGGAATLGVGWRDLFVVLRKRFPAHGALFDELLAEPPPPPPAASSRRSSSLSDEFQAEQMARAVEELKTVNDALAKAKQEADEAKRKLAAVTRAEAEAKARATFLEVTVPKGVRPGQTFTVQMPVTCPPNAQPGQKIAFQRPASGAVVPPAPLEMKRTNEKGADPKPNPDPNAKGANPKAQENVQQGPCLMCAEICCCCCALAAGTGPGGRH